MAAFPPCPPVLKPIQHYLKTANEHEQRDPVVAYWCRMYALQTGMTIDRKSPESLKLLMAVMDWLEQRKKDLKTNEAITSEIVAQAHVENYALKLFMWADSEDRAGNFNKNVVKSFYTAGMLFDILQTFGELSEEVVKQRKYAKWKAAYIHNCLKNGETPIPGPLGEEGEEEGGDFGGDGGFKMPDVVSGPSQPSASSSVGFTGEGSGGGHPYAGFDEFGFPSVPTESSGSPHSSSYGIPIPSTQRRPPVSYSNNGLTLPPGSHAPPSTPSGRASPGPNPQNQLMDLAAANYPQPTATGGGAQLGAEDFTKAQKYCKWASSALQYEDVPTAIDNLQKALRLLSTGKDE